MLVANETATEADLYLVPLDLRLINNTGRYLSLLASKSTQLHNILRYIQQVQKQMYIEFKTSQDLPRRFMQNIEEPLQESVDCTWIQAAYHLVVTGNSYPQVKEWMVDELGERVRGRICGKIRLRSYMSINCLHRVKSVGTRPSLQAMKPFSA